MSSYQTTDIDELIPPAVTSLISIPRHQNQPLSWHHEVHLIGEKCSNPRIHSCDSCAQPILVYGRLIPCKHVFCLDCAENSKNVCMKCQERVIRVEKNGLGSIFRCRKEGCKRTYLSHRDLLAHIKHRHSKKQKPRRLPDNESR